MGRYINNNYIYISFKTILGRPNLVFSLYATLL